MVRFLPFASVAGGVAAFELPMDDWLRVGVEAALGLTAVILLSLSPQHSIEVKRRS